MAAQSASTLSPVSLFENIARRVTLRIGQESIARHILKHLTKVLYNYELPTGYGKTWALLIGYALLRAGGRGNRWLIIVPQTTQLEQYIENLQGDATTLGIDLIGVKRMDRDERTQRYHNENRAEVFVATVQSIVSDPGAFRDLMSTGSWIVGADEHQHYAPDRPWGTAVKELLNVSATIAVSATPIRSDGSTSVFGKPDITVSLTEALRERPMPIRPIRGSIEHYHLDVSFDGQPEIFRLTTESLLYDQDGEEVTDFSRYELKCKLRMHSKYLSTILLHAVTTWQRKIAKHAKEHQMLVFCMTCKHAEFVAKTLQRLPMPDFTTDWIGVGPFGRPEAENTAIIKAFRKNNLSCLVQVDKAGEGFDVKRASTLVFLNLLRRSNRAYQQIGRGLRRNDALPEDDDRCDVFCSPDTELADLVRSMEAQLPDDLRANASGEDASVTSKEEIKLKRIARFFLIDVEHDKSEIVYPFGDKETTVRVVRDETGPLFDHLDQETFSAYMDQWLHDRQKAKPTEEDEIDQAKRNVRAALGTLISNIICLRTGGTYEGSMFGDYAVKINGAWKHKNRGHDAMMVEEFAAKHAWLESINEEIIATNGSIPSWLRL
jgi:superfamily II DNA or RNA helicase